MFEAPIPVKEIIVNNDAQVRLLEDDGTVYADNDTTPTTGGFILEGFLPLIWATEMVLLSSATRIISTATSAAAAQIATYVVTSTSCPADSVFRITYQSLDLTPTEFQQLAPEKRYQVPVQSTTDGIGAAMAAAINADKHAPVTASYNTSNDTLTLTAKTAGIAFSLYADDIVGTWTVTTAAALGIGTYDVLKNREWAANLDFDRNVDYFPKKDATYTTYYFRVTKSAAASSGTGSFPSLTQQSITTDYRLYVLNGLTLETKMNLLVGDLNA